MEMQAEAERRKRAQILESEGERQANINIADGKKSGAILASEAAKLDLVNRAQGEAEAILARAQATAKGIAMVSQTLKQTGGVGGTTVLLPLGASNPASMIPHALTIYKNLTDKGLSEISQTGSDSHIQSDAPFLESDDQSPPIDDHIDDRDNLVKPVFSLQSPKKDKD